MANTIIGGPMGQLVDGTWHSGPIETKIRPAGEFRRGTSGFRNWNHPGRPAPVPRGQGGFKGETGEAATNL